MKIQLDEMLLAVVIEGIFLKGIFFDNRASEFLLANNISMVN